MNGPFNLGNLFRPVQEVRTTEVPKSQPVSGTPQNTGAPNSGMPQNNSGADPANQNLEGANLGADGKPKPEGSALDGFTDFFKVDPKKAPPKDPLLEPLLSMDPKILAERIGKMDFTQGLAPELVQKALAGDAKAFMDAQNHTSRAAFAAAFQALTGVMEGAIKKNNDRFGSSLEGRFRKFQIGSAQSTNPVLNHPAVQPVLASLREMFAQQNPEMHPTDVAKKAEEWFIASSGALQDLDTETAKIKENATKGGGESGDKIDWFKQMGLNE